MQRTCKSADDVSMSGIGEGSDAALLDMAGLHRLVEVLIERGYRVVGPTLRDNAIVLAELESAGDLPRGWGVDVGPGHYRVRRRDDDAAFGHSAGPQSWKQFLHPPRQRLWAGTRDGTSDAQSEEEAPRYAFLGVRGCDLAAIATLDRVLGRSEYPDNSFVEPPAAGLRGRGELHGTGRAVLLRVDGHRTRRRTGLRPRPDGAPGRRRAVVPCRHRYSGGRRCARGSAAPDGR